MADSHTCAPSIYVAFETPSCRRPVVERADGGSAQRRRQRLLRQWLRHEQMTVALAVAEAVHHSSRGQRTATAEATHDAPRSQFAVDVAGGTELFQLYEDELNGVRPPPLAEVRPQGRLEQHTGGGDCERHVPMVPVLDAPVPQTLVRSSMFWTSSCKRSCRKSPTSRCPPRCCVSRSQWMSSRFSMSQCCT